MAIGDIKINPGQNAAPISSPRIAEGAFGEGISRALGSLGQAIGAAADTQAELARATAERGKKQDRFGAEAAYQRWVGEQNRAQAERFRTAEPDGRGVTNQSNEALEASRAEFLQGLPETVREEFNARTVNFVEDRITKAFDFEYKQGNEFFRETTNRSIDLAAGEILAGELTYDEASVEVGRLIGASDLPELEKVQLTDRAEQFLAKAAFQKEMEFARTNRGTVREPTGEDVVAAGLSAGERGLLNAISARESGGKYNVRYGGANGPQTFDDFSQHPGIMEKRPDGRVSSAAGRYQFTLTTWNQISQELGLTDFSPESQDRAAIHLARKIYNRQIGAGELTFDQVLQSGNRDLIVSMKGQLTDASGGWEAFRSMSDDAFANIIMGGRGLAGGGTGSAELPDLWEDPRFDSLPFEDKLKLSNLGLTQAAEVEELQREFRAKQFEQKQNEMFLAATQGGFSLSDEEELLRQGMLRTSEDVTKFRRLVGAATKGRAELDSLTSRLSTGGVITSGDNPALNKLVGDAGVEAVRSMDADYAQQTLLPLTSRAGFVPSEVGKNLNSMVLGSNPEARRYATELLTQVHANNPRALENSPGISQDAVKQAVLANRLRPWYTAEQVQERLEKLRDPTMGAQVATLRKEARKLFEDTIKDSDLTTKFEGWLPGDEPTLPLDPGQQQAFRDDMKQLFVEGYLVSGTEEGALDYAADMAAQQWGVSTIGGERRLMKNSPERFYPSIRGSHDWIDAQVRQEFNMLPDETYQLVADRQTLMEGSRYAQAEDKSGKQNASYQIAVRRENGEVEIITREDGLPDRFAAEINSDLMSHVEQSTRYEQLRLERDELIANRAGAKGVVEPADAQRIELLEAQMQELADNSPTGDPTRLVPEKSVAQLEQDLAVQESRIATERELFESGVRPTYNNAPEIRAEALREEIAKRKANAKN